MARFKNITFDNTDFEDLDYGGFWVHTGTWNASSVGQSGTVSSTNSFDANVSFVTPSSAIAFYYYGLPRSGGGLYKICVDCDPNSPKFETVDGLNITDDGRNPPALLFQRLFDTRAAHLIVLQNTNDTRISPVGLSQMTVDRFVITVADDIATTPLSMSTVTNSASPPSSSSKETSPTRPPPSSSALRSTYVGIITGSVLGGIALLIISGLIWRFRNRLAKARQPNAMLPDILNNPPGQHEMISPFPFDIPVREKQRSKEQFNADTGGTPEPRQVREVASTPATPVEHSSIRRTQNGAGSEALETIWRYLDRINQRLARVEGDVESAPPEYASNP